MCWLDEILDPEESFLNKPLLVLIITPELVERLKAGNLGSWPISPPLTDDGTQSLSSQLYFLHVLNGPTPTRAVERIKRDNIPKAVHEWALPGAVVPGAVFNGCGVGIQTNSEVRCLIGCVTSATHSPSVPRFPHGIVLKSK